MIKYKQDLWLCFLEKINLGHNTEREKERERESKTRSASFTVTPIAANKDSVAATNRSRVLDLRKIVAARKPKWQRKALARKDAEEYLKICHDIACHPLIKQTRRHGHFLKFAVKLLVPDFFVGHPNLFDNLKTLLRHPNFRPLRMALVAWLIFSLTTGSLWGIFTFKAYAAPGTSGVPREQNSGQATEANTVGAADADLNNQSDPNTGVGETTETLYVEIDDKLDPGATPLIRVKMDTSDAPLANVSRDVKTRVYQCTSSSDCAVAGNWEQVGADNTTTVTINNGATSSGYVDTSNTIAVGTSGDINHYSVLAWARDRDTVLDPAPPDNPSGVATIMRVNAHSAQSNLIVAGLVTDKANYAPTNGATVDTVTVSGTLKYEFGAVQADYGGTAETVNVVVKNQNGGTDQTVSNVDVTDATGAFSTTFNLPEAAEFGQWSLEVTGSHNSDNIASGNTDTFLVDLAISDVTYQLFNNDNSANAKETANTGSANMGVPIFVQATVFNNPDGVSLGDIQIQWDVPSPPSNVTFDACTSSCTATTTVPSTAANAGSRAIQITGTATNGGNPAVNVSSSISGFSDRSITLSTTWKYSTVNSSVDNGITTDNAVYNRGETVTSDYFVFNVRDQLITGESASTLTLEVLDDASSVEQTVSNETLESSGQVNWTYLVDSGDKATNDTIGSPKQLRTTDNDGNTVTSGNEWNVSSLLQVSNIFHVKDTSDANEKESYITSVDEIITKTIVKNARGELVSGKTVGGKFIDPFGNTDTTWTHANTDSSGETDFENLGTRNAAGTWKLQSDLSDGSSNSGTGSETINLVSPHLEKYELSTVGWNQEYSKGNTATFTLQTLKRDANDDFQSLAPDATPTYKIEYWTGSAWTVVVAETAMSTTADSTVFNATYSIPDNDNEIGRKYQVRFDAQIEGTNVARSREFTAVQLRTGDPVTIAASPVRANANDTVRLTIRSSNLDGTPLTGNAANTKLYIYDPNDTLQVNGSAATELANGAYFYNYAVGASPTNGVWQAVVVVTAGGNNYSAATNFEVNFQPAKETTSQTIKTNTQNIEKEIEAKLLDMPKTAKSGNSITVKYQAQSGLSGSGAPKLNIYDASDTQRVTDAAMTENASTGIYSATTTLESGWGTGSFTVIVSESTNSTSDSMDLFVGSSDIESIGSDVSSIKTTVEDTNTNVDTLVGGFIVTQSTVNDASAATTSFVTSLTNSTNDFYKNAVLTFTNGTLDGQSRRISAYDGATNKVTLDPALTSAPANGDAFTIVAQNVRVEEQVAAHETSQSSFRSDVSSQLDTIESKIDTITTTLNTVDTNLSDVQSTVNALRTSQQKAAQVTLSDVSEVEAGKTYRAKLTIEDFESNPLDATSTPTILIYDATRSVAQAATTMTKVSTGVYEYSASVASDATTGLWESVVSVDLGGSADITRNDFWQVSGAPAEVLINSMSDLTVSSIAADATITNEGGGAFEYQYEWCVVSSQENQCGGDDDVYYASAAKLIQAGDSFNPTLTATVPNTGDYWFKVVVYFGTEASGASRTFTAVEEGQTGGGGGGGGGRTTSRATHENIYSKIVKARTDLQLNSQKLKRTLEILDLVNPNIRELLEVSDAGTDRLTDIQNKVADLRAISSATRRIVEEQAVDPVVETYMKFNSVEMHFLITNPAETEKEVRFKSFLPEEVKPEHILDANGLEVEFDTGTDTYFVSGRITLGPKESVTRRVEIKDIWVIPEEDIALANKEASDLARLLEETQYDARSTLLKSDISEQLNRISRTQEESYDSPQNHIVTYRENIKRWTRIQDNLEKLKTLVAQSEASRSVVGRLGGIQTIATWGIILAFVVGFGLLAAVIFAMWRNQMTLAAAAAGTPRKTVQEHFGGRGRKNQKRELSGIKKQSRSPHTQEQTQRVHWRLSWSKLFLWGTTAGFLIILGIAAVLLFIKEQTVVETQQESSAPSQGKTIGSRNSPTDLEESELSFRKENILTIQETPTGWLRVRDEATRDGNEVGRVYPGEEYSYTKEQSGWYQIELESGARGWIFGEYATRDNREGPEGRTTETKPTAPGTLRITDTPTGWLRVRSKPSTSERVLDKVFAGEEYRYESEKDGWYYINNQNGFDGWIAGDYVQIVTGN